MGLRDAPAICRQVVGSNTQCASHPDVSRGTDWQWRQAFAVTTDATTASRSREVGIAAAQADIVLDVNS
jgi:hypothetical protein